MSEDTPEKRPRTEGAMQPDLREKIERALADVGEVAYQRRSHHRHCPLVARVLPDEDLLHETGDIVRKRHAN